MPFHAVKVGGVILIGVLVPATAWAQLDLAGADHSPVRAAVEEAVPYEGAGPTIPVESPRPIGAALRALEASFVGLQALDVTSTMRAMERGHTETNPLMRDVAGRPAAMVGVKAGTSVATMWLVRRLARRNRAAAVATMVAIDAAYALVVARNFHVAQRR